MKPVIHINHDKQYKVSFMKINTLFVTLNLHKIIKENHVTASNAKGLLQTNIAIIIRQNLMVPMVSAIILVD